MTFQAKVIKGGKIVIPADLRRQFGFNDGDTLVLEETECGVTMKSYAQVVREVQDDIRRLVKVPFTVDDFLAEKYAEAERE